MNQIFLVFFDLIISACLEIKILNFEFIVMSFAFSI